MVPAPMSQRLLHIAVCSSFKIYNLKQSALCLKDELLKVQRDLLICFPTRFRVKPTSCNTMGYSFVPLSSQRVLPESVSHEH